MIDPKNLKMRKLFNSNKENNQVEAGEIMFNKAIIRNKNIKKIRIQI
jgi:hypothetical protein